MTNIWRSSFQASNGAAMAEAVKKHMPDIAFIDIRMPVMDGLTALSVIRRDAPGTQCVMLSGYAEYEYARKALSLGAMEYLLKPVGTRAPEDVIRRAGKRAAGRYHADR